MPSITSYVSQIPSRSQYFKGDTAVTAYYYPYQASFNFAVGTPTGCVAVDGTNVYFNTYANVRTWLTSTATKTLITDSDFYRDMGKKWTIYVQQEKSTGGYIYLPVLVITKAQRYTTPGQQTEGPLGNPIGGPDLQGFSTVYLVTWTANPDTSTGIPVGVTRVGYT